MKPVESIIIPVSLSLKNPDILTIANCITAREDRGISNIQKMGNGVVTLITEKCLQQTLISQ